MLSEQGEGNGKSFAKSAFKRFRQKIHYFGVISSWFPDIFCSKFIILHLIPI